MTATKDMRGKPLTEKQQRVWDLRESGKTQPEIAVALGISLGSVEQHIRYIRSKLGIAGKPGPNQTKVLSDHVSFTAMKENAVDQVNAKMSEVGLPARLRASFIRRLKVKHEGQETQVRAITDPEMKENIRKNIFLIDSYIDDKVVSEASLRDLATAKAQLVEKLQLLEGKPTQILSDLERKSLIELMPLFLAEAQRRGVTIPGQITEKVVSPA